MGKREDTPNTHISDEEFQSLISRMLVRAVTPILLVGTVLTGGIFLLTYL